MKFTIWERICWIVRRIAKAHRCRYEWVNCHACKGSGKDEYGNDCYSCSGIAKVSKCAQCEHNFNAYFKKHRVI